MIRWTRALLVLLGILALVALGVSIAAAVQGPAFGMGPYGYFYPWHSGLWLGAMVLWMVLFWALVIGGIVWLISALRPREAAAGPEDPLETLRRRYARGEITREQYEEMRRDLRGR